MAVKFLTEDWIDAVNGAMSADEGFQAAIANAEIGLQFVVPDSPAGEIAYSISVGEGAARAAMGVLEGADAVIKQGYETAVAISKGDLNTQAAFISGKLKVEGNLAKLMANQGALTKLADALSGLDIEY